MNASALVVLIAAVGQAGGAAPAADQRSATAAAAAAAPRAAAAPAANQGRSRQLALDAVQLLTDSLAPKADDELTGDPLSLTQALGQAIDPRNRAAVVHAYWQLVAATADYHNRRTEAHFLAQLQAERGDNGAPAQDPAAAEHQYQEAEPPYPSAPPTEPQYEESEPRFSNAADAPLQDGPPPAEPDHAAEYDPAAAPEHGGTEPADPGAAEPGTAPSAEPGAAPPAADEPATPPAAGEPRIAPPANNSAGRRRHQQNYRVAPADGALEDPDRAQLAAALSASRARIQEALVAAVDAQHQLAQQIRAARPVLTSDAPHVGPYRTEFRSVFAGRPAPAEGWRLDRTLPLRQREVLTRTAAVIATEDALDSRLDSYRRGECSLAEVLDALELTVVERQGFVAAVRRYNDDIGDYATLIAPAGANEASLAALLIKPRTARIPAGSPSATRAPASDADVVVPEARHDGFESDGVGAASFNEPIERPTSPAANARSAPPANPRRTPAAAPSAPRDTAPTAPRSAPARSNAAPAAAPRTAPAAPPAAEPSTDELQFDGPPDVSIEPAAPTETQPNNSHSTYRVGTAVPAPGGSAEAATAAVLAETRLYADLAAQPEHRRAQHLTARLAGPAVATAADQLAASDAGAAGAELLSFEPLSIEACLQAASEPRTGANPNLTARRRDAVTSYWQCREQAARVGVCVERAHLLSALGPLVLARRAEADGAANALSWRAHTLAAQAECEQAITDMIVADWQLNVALARPLDRPWYTTVNAPHAGRYLTKFNELAPALVQTAGVRQRADMIPQVYAAVTARAEGVVEADRLRSALLADYAAGRGSLTGVLHSLERQTTDSLAFLSDLTRYNQAIADYALAVVPIDLPIATLAGALVMKSDG